MMHLSPQHRDLVSVAFLLLILLVAFPLLGSWFGERVAPSNTPTPALTAPIIPTPTPEPTKESRASMNVIIESTFGANASLIYDVIPSEARNLITTLWNSSLGLVRQTPEQQS